MMLKVNFHPQQIIADEIIFQLTSNIKYLAHTKYILIVSITQVKA